MKRLFSSILIGVAILLPAVGRGEDYRIEPLTEPPPSDALSDEIVEQLAKQGARVIRGTETRLCDIWLCKALPVKAEFTATSEVSYPFMPGQLIGAIRFSRDSEDFRDQEIEDGVYTLRYALQPVDGAHVGTSLTRDFVLLVRAEDDQATAPLEYDSLIVVSADAAQTNHPAILALKQPTRLPESQPLIRHDEERDWWIVTLRAATAGEKPLPLELVIVGQGEG